MPIFSPRAFQNAYLPVERDRAWLVRLFTALERSSMGLLFGCRMCGNCILPETMYVCPMTCAKGLRNGFCGEAVDDSCVVDETRPCTWLHIYRNAEQRGELERLLENNAPVNGGEAGHSVLLRLVREWREGKEPRLADLVGNPQKFRAGWARLRYANRQPDWWQGDAAFHPARMQEPVSRLQGVLAGTDAMITAEVVPPDGSSTEELAGKCQMLVKYASGMNFADNAFAKSRMSSIASSVVCLRNGGDPVLQMAGRDRSRNGLISDVIGASAMGVRNILCLGGDYHNKWPKTYPAQPDQFDIDSVQMIWMLRRLRDEGKMPDGREIEDRPTYFLGGAGAPTTLKPEYSALRLEKKINAGAQFIQTQMVFDVDRLAEWLEACDKRSLLGKVPILIGVYPLASAWETRFMAREPGVVMPQEILDRMSAAAEKDKGKTRPDGKKSKEFQVQESIAISKELMEKIIRLPGVRGVHIMSGGKEHMVPLIME